MFLHFECPKCGSSIDRHFDLMGVCHIVGCSECTYLVRVVFNLVHCLGCSSNQDSLAWCKPARRIYFDGEGNIIEGVNKQKEVAFDGIRLP
jgi:hypothetical protein